MKQLEDAARILLDSPNRVSSEQRHLAEGVFLNFRGSKHPIVTILHIINHSKVDYVIYQAASALKEALVRDWPKLPKPEITSLQNYLLNYVTTNKSFPSYVKEQIFQVIGVIVKRSGIDGESDNKESILNNVEVMIRSNDHVMQSNGCSILKMILNEYTNTGKSSSVGLAWEAHFQAKKSFEVSDLKRVFRFLIWIFNEFEKCPLESQESLQLLTRFFGIMEDILCWNFISSDLPRKVIEMSENEPMPPLRPGLSWREIFLDKNVINLFFKLHWKIRDNENIVHHSINCLSQLASLHGTIFSSQQIRHNYLVGFLESLVKLTDNSVNNLLEHEVLGLANIMFKLLSSFPADVVNNVPQQLLETFVKSLTNVTCTYAYRAIGEQMNNNEDNYFFESLDLLLQVWNLLLSGVEERYRAQYESAAVMIFEVYLQCHLSPPKGNRPQCADAAAEEEITDLEEDDKTKYADELAMVGRIARYSVGHSLQLLVMIFEEKVDQLNTFLKNIQNGSNVNDVHNLYEDLHWLVLIAGHLLMDISEGEAPVIPTEVMRYSIKIQTPSTVEASVRSLNVTQPCSLDSVVLGDSDPVVRLIAAVFRLGELQKCALTAKYTSVLSPEVSSTLMWFLHRWALTYLFPVETLYAEISLSLNVAFGTDSPSALWCLNFVMELISNVLTEWAGESQVVLETCNLLVAMAEGKERAKKVGKSTGLWNIVHKQALNNFTLSHPKANQSLVKALVKAGTADSDMKAVEQCCLEVLKPLETKFRTVILQENFCRNFHDAGVQKQITQTIDCFIGVIQGCDVHNSQYLFTFLLPLMNELIPLLNLYRNYQEVVVPILECYCEFTKVLLCYLDRQQSKAFYESCLQMMQAYAKINMAKRNLVASAEEEQYEDLLILMNILVNLLSKDFLDIDDAAEAGVSAPDVILFALNILMPLMNDELLRYPQLCCQYYKMITNVCEMYPEKICQLPEGLFKSVIASFHLGLTRYGTGIVQLCLTSISVTGNHISKARLRDSLYYEGVKPFLRVVFEMFLIQDFPRTCLTAGSSALFSLICCYQDQFQEVVQELLHKQTSKENQDRLYLAVQNLMDGTQFADDRTSRLKFREKFENFLVEVRSFLLVK